MGYGILTDQVMLYAAAVLNVVAARYPVSLPALTKLLEEDDDFISELALKSGLSNVVADNIRGNHEADMLPDGASKVDFRDPKIWKDENTFYVIVGNRNEDGSGQLLLYSSEDLKQWKYCGVVDKCENRYGKMWECPDMFPLEGK